MPGKLVGAMDFPGGKRFEVSIYDLLFEGPLLDEVREFLP